MRSQGAGAAGTGASCRSKLASLSFLALGSALVSAAQAQPQQAQPDYVYTFKPGDTLIGLSNRLLAQPSRWAQLQTYNHITRDRQIPPGTVIHIPFAWLKMPPEQAKVEALGGEATASGHPSLAVGDLLSAGTLLRTGADGSVTLSLPDGSTITLQKSTSLSIEALQQTAGDSAGHDVLLKLQQGRTESQVKPHGTHGRFEIQTPVAVSAVRGTHFRSFYDGGAGQATDETTEGTVEVSGQVGNGVPVSAGFGTLVTPNTAPLPPVQLLPAPDLSQLPDSSAGPSIVLAWPAVPGAVRYRVQLAPDQEFHTIVRDTDTPAPGVTLTAPPVGNYFVRVHSIDTLGLEGLDATHALALRAGIPQPLSPQPGVRVAGTHTGFSWNSEAAGATFRWQLARAGDFEHPVLQRDGSEPKQEVDGIAPGSYSWRVAVLDAKGMPGDWSPPVAYTQGGALPVPVATIVKHAVELSWQDSGVPRYRVQVARDAAFTDLVVDKVAEGNRLRIPHLHMASYFARVQPLDGASPGQEGTFGPVTPFDNLPPLWIRIIIPIAACVGFAFL